LNVRVLEQETALCIDCDDAREKEKPHGDADENADDEHEAVEKLLILCAQRRSLSGREAAQV
jgi:hypothetical protein